ncbi:isopentenyl-diphosphate delta-isomerase idi1 [Penicillium taxi]|uniref:isopentenyl-diphosphate delta-isomerase idi1 n=1 Tax=Penicillium taxi TaxID=168475 RepID=UPI0025454933|nr:isopentenyl-diphosphate delta-isomerase idi1 [Penicillium taxi]KAJ5888341.1 isopentenyl-diphosphate delta-isomerase idi1 [Penicillium taxi]
MCTATSPCHVPARQLEATRASEENPMNGFDENQVMLMDEACIVVDEEDYPIGTASKKDCHLMANIAQGLLHRGFGVYIFDSKNRLLLQQRASQKITFPNVWSSSCCSHPLDIAGERGTDLHTAVEGVQRAAQRKMLQELGISAEQIQLEKIQFLTRVYYKAPITGIWGEHEIAYALLVQADVNLDINPNEVQDTRYVTEGELKQLLNDERIEFSPWFRIMCDSLLFDWWKHIETGVLEPILYNTSIQKI